MGSVPCTECMQLTDGNCATYRMYAADRWEVFLVQNVCAWPMGCIPCTKCMQLNDGKYSVCRMCAADWWEVFCLQNICSWPMGSILCTECMQLTNGKYCVCRMYAADWWEVFHVQNVCSWSMHHYMQQLNMRIVVMNTLRNCYVLHTDINNLCFNWCICRLDWCDKFDRRLPVWGSILRVYVYDSISQNTAIMCAFRLTPSWMFLLVLWMLVF